MQVGVGAVALTTALTVALVPAPALADNTGGKTGGNNTTNGLTGTGGDDSGPGDQVSAQMQEMEAAKAAVAEAYVEAAYGEGTVAEFRAARRVYVQRWGEKLPRWSAYRTGPRARKAAGRILAVDQYPQINEYFCGPASGKSILAYLNAGPSAVNGVSQNQEHIGGPAHMKTSGNRETAWSTSLFRKGLNLWRQNSPTGFFVDKASPSASQFRTSMFYDIDGSHPFGADTVEFFGGAHYNGHPEIGRNIGHWLVVRGYQENGDKTNFVDPSANSIYANANPYFTAPTNSFVNTYLQSNGITW
jgi:hypothetical protein